MGVTFIHKKKTIESSKNWILINGDDEKSTLPKIYKVVESMDHQLVANLYYEFEIIKLLQSQFTLTPVEIVLEDMKHLLVFENEEIISLNKYFTKPLPIFNFLKIAIEMTNGFIDMQHSSVIYRNVHRRNFLINEKTYEVKIINFEYAYKFHRETSVNQEIKYIDTDRLSYYAPEETGRLNETIDFRTDLYSLGVLFYEMLTGQLPFQNNEPQQLIYQIMTSEPKAIYKMNPAVPQAISAIVEKLLSKNKADRYQSATGLKEDLVYCWNLVINNKKIPQFNLGMHDGPSFIALNVEIPSQIKLANEVLDQFTKHDLNKNSLIFIKGDTGSGEKELLNKLKNEWTQQNAVVLDTTIEIAMQNVKVAPIILSIRNQLNYIYMEGASYVEQIQELFAKENIHLYDELLKLIPELEWFFSEEVIQSNLLVEVIPVELNHYFNLAIKGILSALLKSKGSLIMMIANVDLMDSSTLDWIRTVNRELTGICFIFTYKNTNETIIELQNVLPEHKTFELVPLTEGEVFSWVAESLKESSEHVRQMARLLFDLTKGNPVYIQELFNQFMKLDLLYYSLQSRSWTFDLKKMEDFNVSKNLSEFFTKRVNDLSQKQKEVLKAAACIGITFEQQILEPCLDLSRAEIVEVMLSLIQDGCIVPLNNRLLLASTFNYLALFDHSELAFRFVHSDIQNVIYKQIDEDQLMKTHYHLAKLLEEVSEQPIADKALIKIVQHYNVCLPLLTKAEKIKVAEWNINIGRNTTRSGLFQNAANFLDVAIELLQNNGWEEHRELMLELWRIKGISEYMNGANDGAERYFNEALSYAKTKIEKLKLYNDKISFYTSISSALEVGDLYYIQNAITTAVDALKLYDIDLKEKVSTAAILKEFSLLNFALRKKPIQELLHLKRNEDESINLILNVLVNTMGSALIFDEKLHTWMIIRMMRLILKHGDVELSSIVYIMFASVLKAGFNDTNRSYEFGMLAIQHMERENKILFKTHVYMSYGVTIGYWKKPYVNSIYYLKLALDYSLNSELHDLFTGIATTHLIQIRHVQSMPIDDILQEINHYKKFLTRTKNVTSIEYVTEYVEWLQVLKTPTNTAVWNKPVTNKTDVSYWESHIVLRLQMSYLLQEENEAQSIMAELGAVLKINVETVARPQLYLYSALWLVKLLRKNERLSVKTKQQYRRSIQKSIKQFRKYSKHAPENFEHLLYLLQAEYHSCVKKYEDAILYYDRAIQLAKVSGFICDQAIASHCAAEFYRQQGEVHRASEYMQQAVSLMEEWGARHVAVKWENQYEHFLPNQFGTSKKEMLIPFDMNTVIEVNQILANETKMDDLIRQVLLLMMKHADANVSYFFKKENDKMHFIGKAELQNNSFTLAHDRGAEMESNSLQSIMQYVLKSEQHVLIDNTSMLSPFHLGGDEKTILCLPIIYQGNMTAILYLANTQMPYVFKKDKIELLKMISSQIAISIEHTKMYEHLGEQVRDRTEELQSVNSYLNEVNERLQQNEIERKVLLQNVSHDLRSPITSVLGYIEAILDGIVPDPKQQQIHLTRSKERLISLNYLIQDLFELSKLESGRAKLELKSWPVQRIFDLFDEKYRADIEQANIVYESLFSAEREAHVMLDLERIEQVLNNLISNAIKYTSGGKIRFSMEIVEGNVIFAVEDNGMGIPEKDLPYIFDMHYRASNNHMTNSYGIGLSICKQIVAYQNGEILVESMEGTGTIFKVILRVEG
ncbi:MAG: ATP-binding protein [Solibacillus sp.]